MEDEKKYAATNILYKNQKFIREKERMLKMFLGHNTQKMSIELLYKILVFL